MSSLKCPRCKSPIKKGATFCNSCGSPVKTEESSIEVKIENEDTRKEKEEKKQNNSKIVMPLLMVILIILVVFLSLVIYFMKDKTCKNQKCAENVEIIEKKPTFQYINFNGYIFKMPLDWNFVKNTSKYQFINKNEDIFVQMEYNKEIDFESFISDDYQKEYLELLKSDENIFIDSKGLKVKNDINYYVMEGKYDNYNYMIVVVPNVEGYFTIKVEFKDNNSYNNKKNEIIEFALSFNQK